MTWFKNTLALLMFCLSSLALAISIESNPEAESEEIILDSDENNLYGSWMFNGGFSQATFSGINPDYRIAPGDTLLMQMWGGVEFQKDVVVDPRGNIFLPKIGPVKVQGVTNAELNHVITKSIKRVYKSNVEAYVTLVSTQKVKVFLSGLVNKPGLYEGQSADSVLKFIDLAGGIRSDIGGYRQIQHRRAGKTLEHIDLYKFLSAGDIPFSQLQDGDVIFVGPRQGLVTVEGEVGFSGKYEISGSSESVTSILNAIVPTDRATHLTVIESENGVVDASQYSLNNIGTELVKNGALLKLSAQLRAASISVEILGEHDSENEMVIPWGTSLAEVIKTIQYTRLADTSGLQLYRDSVAKRQKEMLEASLSALEQSVLTARSSSKEEAQLREAEARIILQWIEKAKQVQPRGQVLLTDGYDASKIILQQGDRIVVPAKKNLVMVHGEVLFPTAVAYNDKMTIGKFINKAGGIGNGADDYRILVMRPNGGFDDLSDDLNDEDEVSAGDEIFVLPEPDTKSLQITKDISQVIYQIAVSAAVVVAL